MKVRIAVLGVVVAVSAAACAVVQTGQPVAGSRPAEAASDTGSTSAPQITQSTRSTSRTSTSTTSRTTTSRTTTSTTRSTTTSTTPSTPSSSTPPPAPPVKQFLEGALNPGDPVDLSELTSAAGTDIFSLGVSFKVTDVLDGMPYELVGHKVGPLLIDPDLSFTLTGLGPGSTQVLRVNRTVYMSGGLRDRAVEMGVLAGEGSWIQLDDTSALPEFADLSKAVLGVVAMTGEPTSFVASASSASFGGVESIGRRIDLVEKDGAGTFRLWYDPAGHIVQATIENAYITNYTMTRSDFDTPPGAIGAPTELDRPLR